MKRLEEKKREKELLLQQVEQEEEYLTNTLQQKLLQVNMNFKKYLELYLNFSTVEKRKSWNGKSIRTRRRISYK